MNLLRVLAASLLILVTPDLSSGEDCSMLQLPDGSNEEKALQGISSALQCFQNVILDSLRENKDHTDNLTEMVLQLKDEMGNVRKTEDCNSSQVFQLNEEKGELKIKLAEKNEKVKELMQLLDSERGQNGEHILEKFELEKRLQSTKDENGQLTVKIHTLETMVKYSQEHERDLAEQLEHLNITFTEQARKKKVMCEHEDQQDIQKLVEEFSWSGNWENLRSGLETILNSESAAFKQMGQVSQEHELWLVGEKGYTELAILLRCGGLPPGAHDADRDTMLHGAAMGGQMWTAAALLDLGEDLEARGSSSRTPIMWAVLHDRLPMVKLLTGRGAALNATTNDGDTVLHIAAREGHLVVLRYLVSAGADTTARGKDDLTALDIATKNNHYAMINFLSRLSG